MAHLGREMLQLVADLAGQPLAQIGPGHVDQADTRNQPQIGRAGGSCVMLSSLVVLRSQLGCL